MFDIPELDDMICLGLERRHLAQCSRVNKQWHRIVTPYLWRDVSSRYGDYQRAAFRSMVLEDYHFQNLLSQDPNGNMNPSCRLPLLSKYSHLIRKIPLLHELMEYLQPPNKSITQPSQELGNAQDKGPTVHDLVRHFLTRCPAIEIQCFELHVMICNSFDILRTTAYFLPYVSHLNMLAIDCNLDSWTAKYILSRCSSRLKKLTFRGAVTNVEDEGPEEEQEPIIQLEHKELILSLYWEWNDTTEFWRWLWKRCGYVEILRVYDTTKAVESLADGILSHMPNLREIHLGRSDQDHMELMDGCIATLLSSCLYGWRVVEIKHTADFREASKAALVKLFPTLEVLILGSDDLKNEDLVLLLSSAPKLQELVTIDDGYYQHRNPTSIRADLFIDLDPGETNTLRTWPCEESLKVLKVVISGIGRADLEKQRRYGITKEVYPGEGRETQNRVYERLARFTKLEKLWLGHHSCPPTYLESYDYAPHYQLDCLDMCLESGLRKLEGLKELRELSLAHMNTRIGLKEIQWMAAHWPKLRRIRGICGEEHECDIDKDRSNGYQEILEWLNEHCPRIEISSSWDFWEEWEDNSYF